jgi:transposase-like protein
MAKHDPEWWAERVAELARGVDASEIARRYGVSRRTVVWWRWKLGRRGAPSRPRLLPVVVRSAPAPVVVGGELEVVVEIGATRMTMCGSVSAEHVAAVVAASMPRC